MNHSPSFHTDAKLDKEVKEGLLYDTLNLLDLRSIDRKKCMEEERRRVKERLMTKPKSRETRYFTVLLDLLYSEFKVASLKNLKHVAFYSK